MTSPMPQFDHIAPMSPVLQGPQGTNANGAGQIDDVGTPLTPDDVESLGRSYVTAKLAERAGLRRVDDREGSNLLGRGNDVSNNAGIVFPYQWPGEPTKTYRLRRDHPPQKQTSDGQWKDEGKYLSKAGQGGILYLPPDVTHEMLGDHKLPVVITEGEKKCLALHRVAEENPEHEKLPYLAVGLPGVWNWLSKNEAGQNNGSSQPIERLNQIVWDQRTVTILFDANAATNPSVATAQERLAGELSRRGAKVKIARMPDVSGVNGIDDLLGVEGPTRLLKVILPGAVLWTPKRYGPFELTFSGVYHYRNNKGAKQIGELVCGPLEVLGHSRDEQGQEWGYLLQWKDPDGNVHKWSVPRPLVVKDGTELAEALAKGGLHIESGKNTLVKKYITAVNPQKKVRNVPRSGWYITPETNQRAFVLPDKVIGGGEEIFIQQDTFNTGKRTVKLCDWHTKVSGLCVGNDILTFAVSIPFASPLLELLGKEAGGFHLYGLSSSGKSTALSVAASVWGYKVETWRTTDNALEDTAERHNDVLLALDELAQVDPKKAAEVAYMLGNGEGKGRLTQTIVPQRKKQWRLLFLSTGEITLAAHVEASGKQSKAGIEVRMVNIDADAGAGMGLFQNIHGQASPAAFADLLKKNAEECRGGAGPAFIEHVLANEADVANRLKALIDDFKANHVPAEASGEIYRVAERFALVGAAGELATEAGITGWEKGAAMASAEWCFKKWLSSRSVGSSDIDKAIEQIRAFLLANQHRFEDLEVSYDFEKDRPVINRAGFLRTIEVGGEETVEYLIPPEVFKKEVCKGHDSKKVAQELNKRGYLRKGTDRLQVQHRVPSLGNKSIRFYAIGSSVLGDEEETASETPESTLRESMGDDPIKGVPLASKPEQLDLSQGP